LLGLASQYAFRFTAYPRRVPTSLLEWPQRTKAIGKSTPQPYHGEAGAELIRFSERRVHIQPRLYLRGRPRPHRRTSRRLHLMGFPQEQDEVSADLGLPANPACACGCRANHPGEAAIIGGKAGIEGLWYTSPCCHRCGGKSPGRCIALEGPVLPVQTPGLPAGWTSLRPAPASALGQNRSLTMVSLRRDKLGAAMFLSRARPDPGRHVV
jgi:hypothetical protein